MLLSDLITRIRNHIGDNDPIEPNITDDELQRILEDSATEYARMKGYIKFTEIAYDKNINVYSLPLDSLKIKQAKLKNNENINISYIDNLTEIILENGPEVDSDVLKITYVRHLKPEDIDLRELDLYLNLAECLCYKLMASKTAELIKFNTGEKMIDESNLSEKYLDLYKSSFKDFKKRAIKAYGKRVNNILDNLDYNLPYPTIGENP